MAKVKKKKKKAWASGTVSAGVAALPVTTKINLNTITVEPEKVDEVKLVKTAPTPKTYSIYMDTQNAAEHEADLLAAFLAMAGTELFQYTNAVTVEGMDSDVEIINVLSSRRAEYTPNVIIDLYPPWLNDIYLTDKWKPVNPGVTDYPLTTEAERDQAAWKLGEDGHYDSLTVDLRGSTEMFSGLVVELYIKSNSLSSTIGTDDYAN
jgi:hypothetical protein